MINLLAPERKAAYRAARTNTLWRRYLIVTLAVLLVLAVIFASLFFT